MAAQNLKVPFRELTHDTKAYVDMRISSLKLQAVEYLSAIGNAVLFYVVMLLLANLALIALMVAFTIWINVLLDSLCLALCITATLCLLLMIPVYIFRNNLFTNNFVRLFSKLFFSNEEKCNMPISDEHEN